MMLNRNLVFKIASLLFIATAIYHVVAIIYPINQDAPLRNAIFIGISLFCAWGFHKRPKYFLFLYIILVIQQFHSHGGAFLRKWRAGDPFDWFDFGVLFFLTVFGVYLIIDWKDRFGKG